MPNSDTAPKKGKKKKPVVNYMQYMGLAFQLFIMLGLLIFAGKWLDNYFGFDKAYVTAFLPLIGLIAYFYKIIKELK
jgi:hypothetical protein